MFSVEVIVVFLLRLPSQRSTPAVLLVQGPGEYKYLVPGFLRKMSCNSQISKQNYCFERSLYRCCSVKFLKKFLVIVVLTINGVVEIVVFPIFITLIAASVFATKGAITAKHDFCNSWSFFTEGRLINFKKYLVPAHFLSFSHFYCDKLLVNFLKKLRR